MIDRAHPNEFADNLVSQFLWAWSCYQGIAIEYVENQSLKAGAQLLSALDLDRGRFKEGALIIN